MTRNSDGIIRRIRRAVSGTPQDRIWNRALEKLSTANDLIHRLTQKQYDGTLSSDCLHDLASIQQQTGSGLLGIVAQANSSSWENARTSNSLQRDLFPGDSPEYALTGNISIRGYFRLFPDTKAEAALPGSALQGTIFFDAAFLNQHSTGYDAALLMHETIHNLGALDPQLMGALGFDPSDPITDKATVKLATDCFGVTR